MEEINYLAHDSNLKIIQNNEYFKMSLDSILLPRFLTIPKNTNRILDLGTGNAPIPLYLSKLTSAKIIGVEVQKEIFDLAVRTIQLNELQEQIEIKLVDIKVCDSIFESNSFDIITCNPPYFKVTSNKMLNTNPVKMIARHELLVNLDDICRISKKLLKNNGILCIVHRSSRLVDILLTMRQHGIEPKKIRLVYTKKDGNSIISLIEGKKNGNEGLKIEPPLYIYDLNGKYSEEARLIFKNGMR